MRLAVVRLITRREIRDLLRDRRTLFLILGLPVLLYPLFVLVGLLFAYSLLDQKVVVGITGIENLPKPVGGPEAFLVGGPAYAVAAMRNQDDPPLIVDGKFDPGYSNLNQDSKGKMPPGLGRIIIRSVENGDAIRDRKVDAWVVIPPDLMKEIAEGHKPKVQLIGREGDETSKIAVKRVAAILQKWQSRVKEVQFARKGLPPDFDEPFEIVDPQEAKDMDVRTLSELRDSLVKFFPFLLVIWTLAGALHPAIDLTAGEKERGTMETLLISPAERSEIVAGKFLAVTLFSYAGAVWNVVWMGSGALVLNWFQPVPVLSVAGLAWAAFFALPLAALFSAVAIGLGVFARSTKEGQYYLMPMFLFVLPLVLWSLAPGLKLTLGLSFVPIVGLSLALQRLMSVNAEPIAWQCWLGVTGSLAVSVLLCLGWAAAQFRRESVLFRETDRVGLLIWLRILIRGK